MLMLMLTLYFNITTNNIYLNSLIVCKMWNVNVNVNGNDFKQFITVYGFQYIMLTLTLTLTLYINNFLISQSWSS